MYSCMYTMTNVDDMMDMPAAGQGKTRGAGRVEAPQGARDGLEGARAGPEKGAPKGAEKGPKWGPEMARH